jgi:hypothetical protein
MSSALALCKEEGKENAAAEQGKTVLQAAQAVLVIKTPFAQAV